jgi:DNA-binding response OmpR family regulator
MATNALKQQLNSFSARQHTLLITTSDQDQRAFLAAQLDADGHTVYDADSTSGAIAKLSAHAIDVMLLGHLQQPAEAPALLRAVRGGQHPRIHPAQPVITIGADDELTVLWAYDCGSDHHVADGTGYVLLRAVLASVARRALEKVTSRHVHVGEIHVDLAARTVDVNGASVHVSRLEFELLVKFATNPSACSRTRASPLHLAHRTDQRTDRRQPYRTAAHSPHERRRRHGAGQQVGSGVVADHPH